MNSHLKHLFKYGEIGLVLQENSGAFPSGANGPHNHKMTPVRNTAHWAITLGYLFSETGDERFKKAAIKAYNWLKNNEFETSSGNLVQRKEVGKDALNGLIGTAWLIESLYYGYLFLNDGSLIDKAANILNAFTFNEELALWENVNEKGLSRGIEQTLNQQVWFNAWASKLNAILGNHELESNIALFNNGIENRLLLDKRDVLLLKISVDALRDMKYRFTIMGNGNTKLKEVPYHIFTLVGFGHLKEVYPNLSIWKSKVFENIVNSALALKVNPDFNANAFGYGYNMTGFELAYVSKVFGKSNEEVNRHMVNQISSSVYVIRDLHTYFARQYEIIRCLR